MARYPIWVKNFVYVTRLCRRERSETIIWLSIAMYPSISRWLNAVTVKGNPVAQRIVDHLFMALRRISDFSLLASDSEVKRIYIRLRGLTNCN